MMIRALCSAHRFSHPTREIEAIETHISHVLLTGDFAYKIKKPVDLGFVDFTTLGQRLQACEDELRLNRRLAPQLYLDLVTICGTPSDPILKGAGTPIEYAVRMRQFPQDCLASNTLERNELAAAHVDALAWRIADFHQSVGRSSAADRYGSPADIRNFAMDNFHELRRLDLDTNGRSGLDEGALERLAVWTDDSFQRLQSRMLERKNQGFVRECHGDLHLNNIVLLEGAPTAFDCIEFNPSLRWIDCVSEVAFLAMDCEARGRADLGRRFINAYFEHTGDYAGLALLNFYIVYRAMVRAKVVGIRAAQTALGTESRVRAQAELHRYLSLALRDSEPARPAIVLTHGYSGSGKSTHTQSLIEATGAIRIRSDVERKRMHGLAALASTDAGPGEGVYAKDATAAIYDQLAALAGDLVANGMIAIVDATFLKRAQRDAFRALAARLQAGFVILDFQASDATLRARIATRRATGRDASEADVAILELQRRTAEPLGAEEAEFVVAIDTAQDQPSIAARLAGVATRLSNQIAYMPSMRPIRDA